MSDETRTDALPAQVVVRGHDMPLEYHRNLLDDVHRMDAYERAIRALVRAGDVVLDVGTGTGILAMLAARRGARVYAVESTPVAGLARQLVAHNGLAERVTVVEADLRELGVIEPVDVVLSECMGRFVVDDGMLAAIDAAAAWLKPNGRFCPARIDMWWGPIGGISMRAVDLFAEPFYGLDLSPAQVYAVHTCYAAQLSPAALVARPARYADVTPGRAVRRFVGQAVFTLTQETRLQGLAGWFDAELAPGVRLTTEPGIETHWGQYVFPVPAVLVEPGDVLEVDLELGDDPSLRAGDAVWRWSGSVRRGRRLLAEFAQESLQRLGRRG